MREAFNDRPAEWSRLADAVRTRSSDSSRRRPVPTARAACTSVASGLGSRAATRHRCLASGTVRRPPGRTDSRNRESQSRTVTRRRAACHGPCRHGQIRTGQHALNTGTVRYGTPLAQRLGCEYGDELVGGKCRLVPVDDVGVSDHQAPRTECTGFRAEPVCRRRVRLYWAAVR